SEAAPFGRALREALAYLGGEGTPLEGPVLDTQLERASESLMADRAIDIDFKKMVKRYWETYGPDSVTGAVAEQTREEILQWFSGEGTIGAYRKRFDVNKMVSKENAKLMLQSLAGFVRLAGYRGLVVLFDEAEQAYSLMRRSQLRDAQNNLLSLINNIESLAGLFLVYATTPDFYTDPKHGIVTYGALQGRIGRPEQRSPSALDTIWNLDEVKVDLETYQKVALNIESIYREAYPDSHGSLPSPGEIRELVSKLNRMHPSVSAVRFWRVLVTALVTEFDNRMMGESRPPEQVYEDVMSRLREA
ncbi:MAG: BREX system ATP-binding domain-containing protein, partial [Anaerolineae bacterium]